MSALDDFLNQGMKKLSAEEKRLGGDSKKREAGLKKLFNSLVPPTIRQYASIRRNGDTQADIVIRLPKVSLTVERYVSFNRQQWAGVDGSWKTLWHAMRGDESLYCNDDLSMVLAWAKKAKR